jgi:hypothetical protein
MTNTKLLQRMLRPVYLHSEDPKIVELRTALFELAALLDALQQLEITPNELHN